jgi:hypothetical protein
MAESSASTADFWSCDNEETCGANAAIHSSASNSSRFASVPRSHSRSSSGTVTPSARATLSREDSVGVAFSFSSLDT